MALFGSVVKGEEGFNSDIDLLIITNNQKLASEISEKCNLEITTLGKWFFPKYDVPENEDPSEYLKKIAREELAGAILRVACDAQRVVLRRA